MPEPTDDVLDLPSSYDRVAEDYTRHIAGELQYKPFDRAILDRFADLVRDLGPACEVGCGPGQVAAYLQGRGVAVSGVDLSPGMVAAARRRHPGIAFEVGDMRALPLGDGELAGLVAFYAILHLSPTDLPLALREFARVLKPGGVLLVAFHIGEETVHRDEWWGHAVNLDFRFLRTSDVRTLLESAGFQVIEALEREPYPEVEFETRRAYLLARTPS